MGQLLAERHYLTTADGAEARPLPEDDDASGIAAATVWVDPRFLVFEYGFDILLRARQVAYYAPSAH